MRSNGSNWIVPPTAEELEISIFGPGFGECVVLHLGQGQWAVIDSCLDPASKRPVALHYLTGLDLNVSAAVRLIVATHWHDDHMRGIADVFQAAPQAVFACTGAVRQADFNEVLSAWAGTRFLSCGSGVDELRSVLSLLKNRLPHTRHPAPRLATAGKVLWESHGAIPVEVRSLSPSDAAVLATIARLAEVMPRKKTVRRRIPDLGHNDGSVALSVRVGTERLLLGADLEVRTERSLGWLAVVDGCAQDDRQHEVFKIPHHGSATAHHDEVWERLLVPEPWAATSPFVSGRTRLPTREDCQRITERTPRAYLTALPQPGRFRDRDRTVQKMISEATRVVQLLPGRFGQVRMRKLIGQPDAESWRVELFGDAVAISALCAS